MLNPFVSQYINSLTTDSSRAVSALFEEARLENRDIESRFAALEQINETISSYEIPEDVEPETTISSSRINGMFNQAVGAIGELFSSTNDLSSITLNYANMLSSMIGEIDKDLGEIEKLIDSFSGVLASDQTSTFIYSEPFSDAVRQETSLESVPDRDGIAFTRSLMAEVQPNPGVAVIPSGAIASNALRDASGRVTRANVPVPPESTDFSSVLNGISTQAWKLDHRSPQRIVAGLASGTMGAQAEIDITFRTPVLCNEMFITPVVPGQEIVSLVLHAAGDETANLQVVSGDPIKLERRTKITFSTRIVQRLTLTLNQPTYRRFFEWIYPEEPRPVPIVRRPVKRVPPPKPKPKAKKKKKKVKVRRKTPRVVPRRRPKCRKGYSYRRGRCRKVVPPVFSAQMAKNEKEQRQSITYIPYSAQMAKNVKEQEGRLF